MTDTPATEDSAILRERYLHKMRTTIDLAAEMGVSRDYIVAMKSHGFKMPGGKASLLMARNFLSDCSDFKVKGRHPV